MYLFTFQLFHIVNCMLNVSSYEKSEYMHTIKGWTYYLSGAFFYVFISCRDSYSWLEWVNECAADVEWSMLCTFITFTYVNEKNLYKVTVEGDYEHNSWSIWMWRIFVYTFDSSTFVINISFERQAETAVASLSHNPNPNHQHN